MFLQKFVFLCLANFIVNSMVKEVCATNEVCGENRKCVSATFCRNRGRGQLDDRNKFAECSRTEVCCHNSDINGEVTTSLPPWWLDDPGCGSNSGCGYSKPPASSTSNTNKAAAGEYPWTVAIIKREFVSFEELKVVYVCGGALIAPKAVLTAAHNLLSEDVDFLGVKADILTIKDGVMDSDRKVEEVINHSQFVERGRINDIAIVVLDRPYVWSDSIQPICLPPPNTNFNGNRCFIAGWGKTKFDRAPVVTDALKKLEVPIVSREQCEENLRRNTGVGRYFELDPSFICAGGEAGKDSCTGDGGTALMCPIAGSTNRYYVAGLVVKGIECGLKDVPALYADVAFAYEWIRKTLIAKGMQLSHATA